jgi:hypothetical protein
VFPASRWLTTEATQKAISVYNAALDRFTLLTAEALARGISNQAFWTPFGRIAVSTRYLARSPYRVGYFDTFIAADHVSVRGMGPRIVNEGLGVSLVGVRKRTSERDQEMYSSRQVAGYLRLLLRSRNSIQLRMLPGPASIFLI